jgi:hypothetical protein
MTPELAAQKLDAQFRRFPWFQAIGVGSTARGQVIFVYVKSAKHRELTNLKKWEGYDVLVRPTGSKIKATRSSRTAMA